VFLTIVAERWLIEYQDSTVVLSPSGPAQGEAAWTRTRTMEARLMQCQDALQKSGLSNQQERVYSQQLRAIVRQIATDHHRCRQHQTRLQAENQRLHADYSSSYQALQISEQSRADLERRIGQQWQAFANLAELYQVLRVYIAGDRISEEDIKIDVGSLVLEKEQLQQQLNHLQHILLEDTERRGQMQRDMVSVREAQETLIRTLKDRDALRGELDNALQARDGLQVRFVQDINVRDQRLAEMQRSLARTRQELRRLRLSHRNTATA